MPSGLTEAERMMIRYVGSMNHGGQDLVALVTAKTGASISTHGYRLRSSRSLSSFFSGHLLLLSRGDMKPVWSRPAKVSGFNLLPMQPSNSPLLIFNRSIESSRGVVSDRPAIAGRSIQLLGLDLRTGKVALNKIFGPTSSVRFYPPLYDVVAGTIDMKFSGWEVRLKLKNSLIIEQPKRSLAKPKVNWTSKRLNSGWYSRRRSTKLRWSKSEQKSGPC